MARRNLLTPCYSCSQVDSCPEGLELLRADKESGQVFEAWLATDHLPSDRYLKTDAGRNATLSYQEAKRAALSKIALVNCYSEDNIKRKQCESILNILNIVGTSS